LPATNWSFDGSKAMKYCSTTRITPNHAVPRKPIKTCVDVSDHAMSRQVVRRLTPDPLTSGYASSVPFNWKQSYAHFFADMLSPGLLSWVQNERHGRLRAGFKQSVQSATIGVCTASQHTTRGTASLSLCVRRLDTFATGVLGCGGVVAKGAEVVW
jgi:hypothetical protein